MLRPSVVKRAPHPPRLGQPQGSFPDDGVIREHGRYSDFAVSEREISGCVEEYAEVSRAVLERVTLRRAQLRGFHAVDVHIERADLSNASWLDAALHRTEMVECRGVGLRLIDALAKDVVFRDCILDMAQFRFTKFERARFEACRLREADFQGADLAGVVFHRCDLRGARLHRTNLRDTDLRTSDIERIQVDAQSLEGAVVAPLQAVDLIGALGVRVQPDDEV